MKIERMYYGKCKKHYADCETVPGSYDKGTKSIDVIIPDGRMKPSGTRGQSFHWMEFQGVENGTGRKVRITIKATCRENAVKRLPTNCTWDIA